MTSQNFDTTGQPDLPEHVRLLKEALDVPGRDSYTFEDLLDVVSAEMVRKNFTEWVVARFVEEGESGTTFEVADGSRPAGTMVAVEAPSVWETWKMQPLTDPRSIVSLVTVDGDLPFVRMQKYTADDRGPGSYGPVLAFPLDVLFGERKRAAEYEEYLRLKAIFEPGDEQGAAEASVESGVKGSTGNGNAARNMQALGLPDPQAGYVGPSESDRQP